MLNTAGSRCNGCIAALFGTYGKTTPLASSGDDVPVDEDCAVSVDALGRLD